MGYPIRKKIIRGPSDDLWKDEHTLEKVNLESDDGPLIGYSVANTLFRPDGCIAYKMSTFWETFRKAKREFRRQILE